jgi:hypothetical protein
VRAVLRARPEERVDPLGNEIRRIRHDADTGPFGWVRGQTHLQGQVLGGSPKIVNLLFRKLVHYQLPADPRGLTGCVVAAHP